jgi:mono/diheme cytochrome c family protein
VLVNVALRYRLFFVVACAVAATLSLGRPLSAPAADAASPDLVARGEYLTHGAGQCIDCHGEDLHGAPMHVPPDSGMANLAPSLAGLPMFASDKDAIAFLTTTVMPDGTHAKRPMPRYTFHTEDATAIVAYLRSLK